MTPSTCYQWLLFIAAGLVGLNAAPKEAGGQGKQTLSCDSIPEWRYLKEHVFVVTQAVATWNANESLGPVRQNEGLLRWYTSAEHAIRSGQEGCQLGALVVRLVQELVGNQHYSLNLANLVEKDLTTLFVDVVDSGWPVFGLLHQYTVYQSFEIDSFSMSACVQLQDDAVAKYGIQSFKVPDTFATLLDLHLQVRPTRLRLPLKIVQQFLTFVLSQSKRTLCQPAILAGELTMALALIQNGHHKFGTCRNATKSARLVERAEGRLRTILREGLSRGAAKAAILLILPFPIFNLLQRIQDSLALQDRGGQATMGLGMDRWQHPVEELVKQTPDFWEHRRQLLRKAIFGPQGGHTRQMPVVTDVSKTRRKKHILLSWDLGRGVKSRAVLSPATPSRRKRHNLRRGLVLLHNGHDSTELNITSLRGRDLYGHVAAINNLGFDVVQFCMPYLGFNDLGDPNPVRSNNNDHGVFDDGSWREPLRYFIEPVLLGLDYAQEVLNHTSISMVGFSGGGWTTYFAAALDERISLSLAAVPTVPPLCVDQLEWMRYDYELRYYQKQLYQDCGFLCMHVLATRGQNLQRWSVHLFHYDEDFPYPSPNCVKGLEHEFRYYYKDLLPRILAPLSSEAIASRGPPLRMMMTHAQRHEGDRNDLGCLQSLLQSWGGLQNGQSDLFSAWPLPGCSMKDVNHLSD